MPDGRSSRLIEHAVIVLAAGEGTRMRSSTPKVLHDARSPPTRLRHLPPAGQGRARDPLTSQTVRAAAWSSASANVPG